MIDLRAERPGPDDPRLRRLMVGRLQHLKTMGLAAEDGLPAGLQVIAPAGADERMYTVGAAIEALIEATDAAAGGAPVRDRVPAVPATVPGGADAADAADAAAAAPASATTTQEA